MSEGFQVRMSEVTIRTTHFDSFGQPTRAEFTVDGRTFAVKGTREIRTTRAQYLPVRPAAKVGRYR